ncbi:hypothetical protein AX15_004710 [Amanita polypyramis BW_CC]|nr:hypothetical protein AX15_004710 [Amanita polypyramis BW_CC]
MGGVCVIGERGEVHAWDPNLRTSNHLYFPTARKCMLFRRVITAGSTTRVHFLHANLGAQIKHQYRGGQNLSERYKRLERSLRGKAVLEDASMASNPGSGSVNGVATKDKIVFGGLEIPKEPKSPESDECCMSGCAVCVYDLYEEAMERYREEMGMVEGRLRQMGVEGSGWPVGKDREGGTRQSVVLDAFGELERQLAAKRDGAAES